MTELAASQLSTQHLFGCDFLDRATLDDVVEVLLVDRLLPQWRCTVTPNVDHLVRYDRHPEDLEVAQHATLVLPDGMPVVWASKWLGAPLARRLTGSDLFALLWPRLAAERIPAVVVASTDSIARGLTLEHTAAETIVPPRFDVEDDTAVDELVERIVETCAQRRAEFLFVGLSMPKANLLARRLRARWEGRPSPQVLLVGAAPDFYLGEARRAPKWMQDAGLEWLDRLVKEPRRMARRYLVDDPWFIRIVLRERRRRRHRG